MSVFDSEPSLCERSTEEVAAFLEDIEDIDAAQAFRARGPAAQGWFDGRKWMIGSHMFGYVPQGVSGPVQIQSAFTIAPDTSLIGQAIKVSLDKFRIASYPGQGQHRVLTEIFGRNQADRDTEDLRFSTVLTMKDRDSAGLTGVPIFTGLTVPPDGLALEARTILVGSSTDDAIIDALESGPFKEGLKLIAHVQPVLPQLITLAAGATAAILKRRKNSQIQKFIVGLDFSETLTSAKLRLGSYVVMQAPDDGSFDWADWRFDPGLSNVVNSEGEVAPYNTLVFGVSKPEVRV
ncbi:MAG: hypothetical protein EBR82_20095 [Caulobacteraceae bacterium]|nr:hypothetical protein [Caulobacteraceae bacterium]